MRLKFQISFLSIEIIPSLEESSFESSGSCVENVHLYLFTLLQYVNLVKPSFEDTFQFGFLHFLYVELSSSPLL